MTFPPFNIDIKKVWRIYANIAGAFILCTLAAFALAVVMYHGGKVVAVVDEANSQTRIVAPKGEVRYAVTVERFDSCPGDLITYISTKTGDKFPAIVTIKRPLVTADLIATDMREKIDLPPSVTPGIWTLRAYIESNCPLYKRRDLIATFDLEVVQ